MAQHRHRKIFAAACYSAAPITAHSLAFNAAAAQAKNFRHLNACSTEDQIFLGSTGNVWQSEIFWDSLGTKRPPSWCEHKPPKQETITLQLYLAASNFDCLTFFSHQVGVNTSHRSKKLSTSTASATCHSRFVNNAIFPSIYNVLSISSIMQIEVCH